VLADEKLTAFVELERAMPIRGRFDFGNHFVVAAQRAREAKSTA
jgi:hypothetical protein